jgi:hypothetical protein
MVQKVFSSVMIAIVVVDIQQLNLKVKITTSWLRITMTIHIIAMVTIIEVFINYLEGQQANQMAGRSKKLKESQQD